MGAMSRINKFSAAAAITLTAALAVGATPATAASTPLDITTYQVKDLIVSSPYCYDHGLTAKVKKSSSYSSSSMATSIKIRGKEVGAPHFNNKKFTTTTPICAAQTGYGAYTLDGTTIWATVKTKSKHGITKLNRVTYKDATKKTFYVRAKTASTLKAQRAGTKVTLTATSSKYSPAAWGYLPHSPSNAKLQVKAGKTWKTVKTLKLKNGKATVALKTAQKKTYRISIPQTSTATAASSKTVTK